MSSSPTTPVQRRLFGPVYTNLQHNPYVDSFPQSGLSPYFMLSKFPQRTTRTNKKLVILPPQGALDGDLLRSDDVVDLTSDPERARTVAERMSKEQRFILPRVTSYCVAEAFSLEKLTKWAREIHNAQPKQYDECLYISYNSHKYTSWNGQSYYHMLTVELAKDYDPYFMATVTDDKLPAWMLRQEVFVFDYGVAGTLLGLPNHYQIVFWNFTEADELRYLDSIARFCSNLLDKDDYEIESLHFQYDLKGPIHPRIFNDMIT